MIVRTLKRFSELSTAGYASIATAFLLVLLTSAWGAWREIDQVRRSVLDVEISRLRSQAKRVVGRIENHIEEKPNDRALTALKETRWLRDFWQRVVPRERQRLYTALVAADGTIVMHSDPTRQGDKLGLQWFDHRVWEAGDDVVETRSQALAGGQPAYDIQIPIELDGAEIGTYHSGFDIGWLETTIARERRSVYVRWMIIGAIIVCIVLAASFSLFNLARRTTSLQHALAMSRTQQLAELGRLAGALAHEIRNPLNAIRLNLHSLHRYLGDGSMAKREEIETILTESDAEVQRLERLIKSLLGYARPEEGRVEDIDVRQEIEAVVAFLDQLMKARRINMRTDLPPHAVDVRVDRDRFKQSMLNILNNAADAIGREGEIAISLRRQNGSATLTITDTGPGVAEEDRDSIFDPFYTTKDTGCGLGLALARRFVSDSDGTIALKPSVDRGAVFEIQLPTVHRQSTNKGS